MHFGLLSIFQNYRDEHDDGDIMRAELAPMAGELSLATLPEVVQPA